MDSAFAISVNAIDDLFDPYTAEPLERRPLREEVRTRILNSWIDNREHRPDHLSVELPVGQRRDGVGEAVEAAIGRDLDDAYRASRNLMAFKRSERREALIAFGFLVVCLLASTLIDQVTENDALFTSISQGLVVLGWVAMWQPAQQMVQAISLRLSKRSYQELAGLPVRVSWA
jgi:hypothetical protein